MVGSSAGQLYSQRQIGKLPMLLKGKRTSENLGKLQKTGQRLSLGYMALTSSTDAYDAFKEAGASDLVAGLGFLATSAAL